jgi:biofilm protein TabA
MMITDHLDNINIYKCMPDIYIGLQFIAKASPEIELGTYELTKQVKILVTEYETVHVFERGYEAHQHCIDIQYPIIGYERVKWSPLHGMSEHIPYDETKDRTFYQNPSSRGTHVDIGGRIFGIFFPQDAHSPQHCLQEPEWIKKITVKVNL